jgi:hypothetical protein
MAKKIASLYAEIGADTTKLKSGLDETKGQLTQAKAKFDNLKASILPAIGIVAGFGAALKGAYDTAKEGAAMEFAIGKFDRLAESAGTTADVLLDDLKKATRGTVSDMQLMASAGDFMALGLAKTSDEVVRLTRVAGALGMDMNQLVLTMTNQTTMRFDALGVSVDGFDEKVAALKKTGMDAGAAFKEAFLQQAEEQIEKVGDKADTAAGQVARMEASFANLGDTIKTKAAGPLGNIAVAINALLTGEQQVVGAVMEHEAAVRSSSQSYAEYSAEMERVMELTKLNAQVVLGHAGSIEEVYAALGILNEETYRAIGINGDYVDMAEQLRSTIDDESTSMTNLATNSQNVNAVMGELTSKMIFNAAAANLDGEAALALAKSMGLVNEDTYAAMQALDEIQARYDTNKDGIIENTEATQAYIKEVAALEDITSRLQDKHITITTDMITNHIETTRRGDSGGYGGARDEEYANGGQFVIPPGYEDHSWPVGPGRYAESGETVTITPQGESSAAGMTIIQNIYTQLDYEVAAAEIMERIRRER